MIEHPQSEPILPPVTLGELIPPALSCVQDHLILRVSFKTESGFVTVSLVCDTGAPGYLYLSEEVMHMLQSRLMEDEDTGVRYLECDGRKVPYTPGTRNTMGFKLLCRFGLKLSHPRGQSPTFSLQDLPTIL